MYTGFQISENPTETDYPNKNFPNYENLDINNNYMCSTSIICANVCLARKWSNVYGFAARRGVRMHQIKKLNMMCTSGQ